MKPEEAINQIEEFMVIDDWSLVYLPDLHDALELAIEALKDRPHGEWKNERFSESHALYFGKCSQCGKTGVTGNFCSVCGSDNRKMGEAK